MAGLVPAIHVFLAQGEAKTWMPGKAGHDEQYSPTSSEMRTGAGTGIG